MEVKTFAHSSQGQTRSLTLKTMPESESMGQNMGEQISNQSEVGREVEKEKRKERERMREREELASIGLTCCNCESVMA